MIQNIGNTAFLRNDKLSNSRETVKNGMLSKLDNLPDGSIILGRYSGATASDVKTIAGLVYSENSVKTLTFIDVDGTTADITALRTEINNKLGSGVTSANTATMQFEVLNEQISGMNLTVVSGNGEVITAISETNGVVSASKTPIKDVKLSGYSKGSATGSITSNDDINTAISKIENGLTERTLSPNDKSVNVVTNTTGTTVALNIRNGEKVIKLDTDATSGGVYTNLNLVKITDGLPETVKERYKLMASDNTQIGSSIDIPKDSHIMTISYISDPSDAHYQNLVYEYVDASGVTQVTYVDMSELVLEVEFASGVTTTNHVTHGVVDPSSESFLTVGENGFKLSGVQSAITSAVNDEVTARKNIDGQTGTTYVANVNTKYISGATSLNDADVKLDTALSGLASSAITSVKVNSTALSKDANNAVNVEIAAATSAMTGTTAIVVDTNSQTGKITIGLGVIDCGEY